MSFRLVPDENVGAQLWPFRHGSIVSSFSRHETARKLSCGTCVAAATVSCCVAVIEVFDSRYLFP
jgi:hypothetical protein